MSEFKTHMNEYLFNEFGVGSTDLDRARVSADWPFTLAEVGPIHAYEPSMTAAQAHDIWVEGPRRLTSLRSTAIVSSALPRWGRTAPGSHVSTWLLPMRAGAALGY